MKLFKPVKMILLIFLCISLVSNVFAQETPYLEDDGTSLWEEQKFFDSIGEEFESGQGQYLSEEEVGEIEKAAKKARKPSINLAEALEKDKQLMPDNIIYGLGTGLTIGGWFALLQGKSARDNVRYLGTGIVSGVLLGVIVGSKSIYQQLRAEKLDQENSSFDKTPRFTYNIIPFKPDQKSNNFAANLNFQFKF